MVESQPSKLLVAGSIPVSRSRVSSGEELFGGGGTESFEVYLSRAKAHSGLQKKGFVGTTEVVP